MQRSSTRRNSQLVCLVSMVLLGASDRAATQQPSGGAVEGRVIDTEGLPVAEARIRVVGGTGTARAVSRPDGYFQLRGVQESPAVLRVTAAGYEPLERALSGPRSDGPLELVLTPAPFQLPAATVTGATRQEVAALRGSASIVGRAVLRERAPLSVMDALRTVPGVQTADEDPFGLNLNVSFRGLPPRRSARTLLLEDGVPILLGPYGDPTMHYAPPVEVLERVEVVKGSAQIRNGPQTVGGVVNLVTRRPPTEGTLGEVTLGGGGLGYRNGTIWFGTARDGFGLSLDYAFREGEGLRREQAHRTHFATLNAMVPLSPTQSIRFKASAWDEGSTTSETGLTQAEFEADPFSLPFTLHDRFDVRRYLGQVLHEGALGGVRLFTNAYLSSTDRASWRQSGESAERIDDLDYLDDFNCAPQATTYAECGNQGRPRQYLVMGIEPRASFGLPASSGLSMEVGARLYRENVRRRQYVGDHPRARANEATLTRDNEIGTRVGAAFVEGRIATGGLAVTPAVRVERVSHDIANRFPGREVSLPQSYSRWLPGIGTTVQASPSATLFAGVHRGFAPPRPADLYRPEPGQPIVLLDPETSWNWEMGSRLAPRPGMNAELALFRTDFKNQVVEAPVSLGQRFVNGGRTVYEGAEMSGSVTAPVEVAGSLVSFGGSYTFLPVARFADRGKRRVEVAGNRLPYAPRHLGSLHGSFLYRGGLMVGTALEYTGQQFADDLNTVEAGDDGQTGVLPGYAVTNAFASYRLPGSGLEVRGSVRNLFDRTYITQRNEGIYTGMRRMARVELSWAF